MVRARYHLSIPAPHTHLLQIEAVFDDVGELGGEVELRMASWTPGSYLVRDYARHVQDVVAVDEQDAPLAVRKRDKATWLVKTGSARTLKVRYRVYGWELTVRTNHIDDSHAFLNGAPTYLWIPARAQEAAEVTIAAPEGWRVACGLTPVAPDRYLGRSVDELIDSPIHVGPGEILEWTAAGKPTQLATWGRPEGQAADFARLSRDATTIIEHYAGLFAGVPYDRYVFQLMLAPGAYGGLEHKASTALLSTPGAFATQKKYEDLLELVSHEYFHLWNVKRIHPRALGPFDYSRENYTRSLWVMEGLTSYVDRHTLVRTGLMAPKRYLEKLAAEWGKLLGIPGRKQQSIEESSFDAWVKLYRPDENSVNSTVSYYLKGGLVCACLDLEIRRRSGGARGLDHVLLHLWHEHGQSEQGFDDDQVQALFEKAAGLELGAFFDRHVRGREDPPLVAELAELGLTLRGKGNGDDKAGWLGVVLSGNKVSSTLAGSPAESAGLYAGDELVALDGYRCDSTLGERLGARKPGHACTFTVFRRDELREVKVVLGEPPVESWEIVADKAASEAQKARQADWLGKGVE